MNILITGVSGYLGMRLAEELVQKEDFEKIVGLDIVSPKKPLERCDFFEMDVRDPTLGKTLSEYKIDTVIHMAFVVSPIHDLNLMHDIDYNGTRNVMEQALAMGVKHFVAISSTLAYGAHPDNPSELLEDAALRGEQKLPLRI